VSKKKAPKGKNGTYTAAQQAQLAWLKKNYPFTTTSSSATSRATAKAATNTSRAKAKTATKKAATKARSLSPGDFGCCTAEAVAAYLRLQGVPFSDADMLALFRRAGGHPDDGAPIREVLEASGLAFTAADLDAPGPLILGLELPGPHAVLATADGWWSWGELHCPCEFPDAVIEEAWVIS
jgi:hypothetical protein